MQKIWKGDYFMKNVIGVIIFFITGIILGGCILQLNVIGSIILGNVFYTIYQVVVVKDITFPIITWGFIGACAILAWLLF